MNIEEITKRHEYYDDLPDCLTEVRAGRTPPSGCSIQTSEAHKDRGELLKRVEELEAALPKWTLISDDPDTWPEDGQRIIYTNNTPTPYIVQWHSSYVDIYLGLRWRPLCDLDYPPKGEG